MNRSPNDEEPTPLQSHCKDAGSSEINLTPGKVSEVTSAVNASAVNPDEQLTCGHRTIDDCAAADIAALFPKSAPSEPAGPARGSWHVAANTEHVVLS
jgi:hypothetical protein